MAKEKKSECLFKYFGHVPPPAFHLWIYPLPHHCCIVLLRNSKQSVTVLRGKTCWQKCSLFVSCARASSYFAVGVNGKHAFVFGG
ncbi:hypothetical protein CEXT_798011 [Caerostris extrusa]|uniref:Uncharacterized protein n=1 Tax=Caerostris extrusa TaxID=172846 RepID=A0AAV4V748_CAEEX|nr:hypothetical protein CEXT_798011 [Caerostris extrusa]